MNKIITFEEFKSRISNKDYFNEMIRSIDHGILQNYFNILVSYRRAGIEEDMSNPSDFYIEVLDRFYKVYLDFINAEELVELNEVELLSTLLSEAGVKFSEN